MKHTLLITCLASVLIPSVLAMAQSFEGAQAYESFMPYGDISPSVESFAMTKYGAVSPSLYSGTMSYSIPLYTYSDPEFSIPVSLDYNYDGYRPAAASGTIGLGWALNCGGVITREVRGIPDEGSMNATIHGWYDTVKDGINVLPSLRQTIKDIGYSGNSGYLNTYTYDEYIQLLQSLDIFSATPVSLINGADRYDLAPDIFHFNFCGIHGDFMMTGEIGPDGIEPVIKAYNCNVPNGELSVEFHPKSYDPNVPQIIITDGTGTRYYFGDVWRNTESSHSYTFPYSMISQIGTSYSTSITAFRLYKIEHQTREGQPRIVEFCYSNQRQVQKNAIVKYKDNYSYQHTYSTNDASTNLTGTAGEISINCINGTCYSLLEEMKVDNRTVLQFSYDEKVEKEDGSDCFEMSSLHPIGNVSLFMEHDVNGDNHSKKLSCIQVLNDTREEVERFNFVQEYATGGTPKMFLHSVSGKSMGEYTFDYNLSRSLPANDTKSIDHWGFWNGKNVPKITSIVNRTVPYHDIFNQIIGNGKESNWQYGCSGALLKITYPTGGYSEIEYEGNIAGKYILGRTLPQPFEDEYPVGGIRVKKISNVSPCGVNDAVAYFYRDSLNASASSGTVLQMPKYVLHQQFNFSENQGLISFHGNLSYDDFSGQCNCIPSRNNHIGYSRVFVMHSDSSYVVHTFSNMDALSHDTYNHASRSRISQQRHSYYESFTADCDMPWILPPEVDKQNMRGLPLSEECHDRNGSVIRTKTMDYAEYIVSAPLIVYPNVSDYIKTHYDACSPQITRITETVYNNGHPLSMVEEFEYNDRCQIYRKSDSDGMGTTTDYFKYSDTANVPRAAKSAAVRTSTIGTGAEKIIAKEEYQYEPYNVKPTMVTSYPVANPRPIDPRFGVFNTPAGNDTRVCTFTYDGKFRLTGAQFPGSAYIEYGWDGNHIVSKTVNIPDNMFLFNWKDLVGLTRVQDPSGKSESYLYDAKNRLMQRKDTQGNPTEEYHYHLENEQ